EANSKNLRVLEHQKRVIGAKAERDRKTAETQAKHPAGPELRRPARAGEGGRLFGSVTNLDIERLLAARGVTVDRRRIELDEPIKQLGTYPVVIQVGRDVRATVQVIVGASEAEQEERGARA